MKKTYKTVVNAGIEIYGTCKAISEEEAEDIAREEAYTILNDCSIYNFDIIVTEE